MTFWDASAFMGASPRGRQGHAGQHAHHAGVDLVATPAAPRQPLRMRRAGATGGGARRAARHPGGEPFAQQQDQPDGAPPAAPGEHAAAQLLVGGPERVAAVGAARGPRSRPFFFPSRQGPLDAARMDLAAEALPDAPRQLRRAAGTASSARCCCRKSTTSALSLCARRGPGFFGTSAARPPRAEARLRLIEGGTREAERRRAAADGLPVDAHAPHHLVLDLDQIAGVEEVGGGEERIVDPLRMRVEAALLAQRVELGVRGLGSGPLGQSMCNIFMPSSPPCQENYAGRNRNSRGDRLDMTDDCELRRTRP